MSPKHTTQSYAVQKVLTVETKNSDFPVVKITNHIDSAKFARQFYGDDLVLYESFFLIFLNSALQTVAWAKISQGGVVGTVVDTKIVCKYAVDSLAQSVILVHNHPSGNLKSSGADREITRKIIDALENFDVAVKDHIILTESSHLSMLEEGTL
jgi:DNA repair protein RadC